MERKREREARKDVESDVVVGEPELSLAPKRLGRAYHQSRQRRRARQIVNRSSRSGDLQAEGVTVGLQSSFHNRRRKSEAWLTGLFPTPTTYVRKLPSSSGEALLCAHHG